MTYEITDSSLKILFKETTETKIVVKDKTSVVTNEFFKNDFQVIPRSILEYIFSLLDQKSQHVCFCVCKNWKEISTLSLKHFYFSKMSFEDQQKKATEEGWWSVVASMVRDTPRDNESSLHFSRFLCDLSNKKILQCDFTIKNTRVLLETNTDYPELIDFIDQHMAKTFQEMDTSAKSDFLTEMHKSCSFREVGTYHAWKCTGQAIAQFLEEIKDFAHETLLSHIVVYSKFAASDKDKAFLMNKCHSVVSDMHMRTPTLLKVMTLYRDVAVYDSYIFKTLIELCRNLIDTCSLQQLSLTFAFYIVNFSKIDRIDFSNLGRHIRDSIKNIDDEDTDGVIFNFFYTSPRPVIHNVCYKQYGEFLRLLFPYVNQRLGKLSLNTRSAILRCLSHAEIMGSPLAKEIIAKTYVDRKLWQSVESTQLFSFLKESYVQNDIHPSFLIEAIDLMAKYMKSWPVNHLLSLSLMVWLSPVDSSKYRPLFQPLFDHKMHKLEKLSSLEVFKLLAMGALWRIPHDSSGEMALKQIHINISNLPEMLWRVFPYVLNEEYENPSLFDPLFTKLKSSHAKIVGKDEGLILLYILSHCLKKREVDLHSLRGVIVQALHKNIYPAIFIQFTQALVKNRLYDEEIYKELKETASRLKSVLSYGEIETFQNAMRSYYVGYQL